ncbi:hypothetical protein V2J09_014044 [Rumex salicifolius]
MSSNGPKSSSSKPSKPSTNISSNSSRSSSSSLSAHLAMVELKQRILTSLSKLSDRDTHQIALEELESAISTLQNEAVPMLLNTLFDSSSSDPKPAVKKHSVRLIATLCASHADATATHLVKIVSHIAKRLRDSDSGVRDACRDAIGVLSAAYIDGGGGGGGGENGVVSLFMKPLLDALGENDKGVQVGAAMCLGRVVECAKNPPVLAFHKLGARVCKYLHSPNFFAKSALMPVISIMSQMGAISPQSLESLLQSIHECLGSSDWATRKAAAETLSSMALYSGNLVKDITAPTLTALEACRFDKIKPVRDSMVEALQHWKKIAEKAGDEPHDEPKTPSRDPEKAVSSVPSDKTKQKAMDPNEKKVLKKDSLNGDSSISDSVAQKSGNTSDRTVGLLKKKIPALNDKELNPEFFQKLEKRGSNDLPVEVVVSRKCSNSSNTNEDESEQNVADNKGKEDRGGAPSIHSKQDYDVLAKNKYPDGMMDGKNLRTRAPEIAQSNSRALEIDNRNAGFTKADAQSEGSFGSSKGNWLAIQRQLLHLERQQTHLMNMLQDFMGGSHESMVSLESRVRGLERVVEDMVEDLSLSSGRRGNSFMSGLEGPSSRNPSRYGSYYDSNSKFGRSGDGKFHFGNGISSGMRGRNNPSRRSDHPDSWEFNSYGAPRAGSAGCINHLDGRSPTSEPETDHIGGRRAWDKGVGPIRLGEGPSARSVWQASKDEATLAAIRVAGEDNGTTRAARVAIPEMTAEAMGNDNCEPQDPVWAAWSNAMDAVHSGDIDSAFAEVLSIGDDFLLVKLMDRSGPALDQLTNEIAVEVLNSISQLLMDQTLFDLCMCWIQQANMLVTFNELVLSSQLADFVMENGPDVFGVPKEIKRELLYNLHQASSNTDLPEDWEGATPEQLILHLASTWGIKMQHGN